MAVSIMFNAVNKVHWVPGGGYYGFITNKYTTVGGGSVAFFYSFMNHMSIKTTRNGLIFTLQSYK